MTATKNQDVIVLAATTNQPVSDLQLNQLKIEWVRHDSIKPNKYNPNRMTYKDRLLLKQSLLEDGWTQPIVTLLDQTIVDGEQRWTTAGLPLSVKDIEAIIEKMEARRAQGAVVSDSILSRLEESKRRLEVAIERGEPATLAAITGSLVPITRVDFGDDAHKMISTIRHNRARGSHLIDSMAAITEDLQKMGLDVDDLETRLGMSREEVKRLVDDASQAFRILEENTDFSTSWQPVHISELTEDQAAAKQIQRSREASTSAKNYQVDLAKREIEVKEAASQEITRLETLTGKPLNQIEKAAIVAEQQRAKEISDKFEQAPTQLRRFSFYVEDKQYEMCRAVLLRFGENEVLGFVKICEMLAEQEIEVAKEPL